MDAVDSDSARPHAFISVVIKAITIKNAGQWLISSFYYG
jgi:hypothetical protein